MSPIAEARPGRYPCVSNSLEFQQFGATYLHIGPSDFAKLPQAQAFALKMLHKIPEKYYAFLNIDTGVVILNQGSALINVICNPDGTTRFIDANESFNNLLKVVLGFTD